MKSEKEIRDIIGSLKMELYKLKIAHNLITTELKTKPRNILSAKYILAKKYLTEIRDLEYILYGLHLALGEEYEIKHKQEG